MQPPTRESIIHDIDEAISNRNSIMSTRNTIMSTRLSLANVKTPSNISKVLSPEQGKEMLQLTMQNIRESVKGISPSRGFSSRLTSLLQQFDSFALNVSAKIEKINERIDALEQIEPDDSENENEVNDGED